VEFLHGVLHMVYFRGDHHHVCHYNLRFAVVYSGGDDFGVHVYHHDYGSGGDGHANGNGGDFVPFQSRQLIGLRHFLEIHLENE